MARDIAFYRRREQQERAIAHSSINAEIAAIHAAMAARYAALAQTHPCENKLPARSEEAQPAA